jgi:hypothetical protein
MGYLPRVYFTGFEQMEHLRDVLIEAINAINGRARDANLDKKETVRLAKSAEFVKAKILKALDEEDLRYHASKIGETDEETMRRIKRETDRAAAKAYEEIKLQEKQKRKMQNAKERGDIEKRGHFH